MQFFKNLSPKKFLFHKTGNDDKNCRMAKEYKVPNSHAVVWFNRPVLTRKREEALFGGVDWANRGKLSKRGLRHSLKALNAAKEVPV